MSKRRDKTKLQQRPQNTITRQYGLIWSLWGVVIEVSAWGVCSVSGMYGCRWLMCEVYTEERPIASIESTRLKQSTVYESRKGS